MPIMNLTHENLGELAGGDVAVLIDQALIQLVQDLEDRGDDGKPRKITFQLIVWKPDPVRDPQNIASEFQAKVVLPDYRSRQTRHAVSSKAGVQLLAFSSGAPDNPNQPTMFEANDDSSEPMASRMNLDQKKTPESLCLATDGNK